MADPVTTLAIVGGGTQLMGGIVQTMGNAQKEDAKRQEALYNAKQFENDAKLAYMEKATTSNMATEKAVKQIATGRNVMAGAGNIGSSAQRQVMEGAFNLDKDLSAIAHRYENVAVQAKNAAKMQRYNADVYKRNRTNALIGGMLGATATSIGMYGNLVGFGSIPRVAAAGTESAGAMQSLSYSMDWLYGIPPGGLA